MSMTEQSVFSGARGLSTAVEQAAYLDKACAGNPELRRLRRAVAAADCRSSLAIRGSHGHIDMTNRSQRGMTYKEAQPRSTFLQTEGALPGQ